MQEIHEKNIRYCLDLALRGLGQVSPNPMVGAILIHNHQIIGQGWHHSYGGPHAEQNAIDQAIQYGHQQLIPESTLYVSLEPCNHYGKTPPCTSLIIKHNIKLVVFGAFDPNPTMSGKSIDALKKHGIEVIGPILETKSNKLIQTFRTNMIQYRPYVILKFAQSADHFISKWDEPTKISNPYSNVLTHKWRSEVDGILIGRKTLEIDNPLLNNRHWYGKHPRIIILTSTKDIIKSSYKIFDHPISPIISSEINHQTNLESILKILYLEKKIGILLVEGGAKVLLEFIKAGIWDEARIITNTKLNIKEGLKAPKIKGKLTKTSNLLSDMIQYIQRIPET